jgi:PilZ domain-containing protein
MLESVTRTATDAPDDRRQHDRVPGPFDGCRIGLIDTPVRIYDLSLGGCFINSAHEQQSGVPLVLKIHLPHEGWVTVKGETLYGRAGFGFPVRFVEIEDDQRLCLERSLDRLLAKNRV